MAGVIEKATEGLNSINKNNRVSAKNLHFLLKHEPDLNTRQFFRIKKPFQHIGHGFRSIRVALTGEEFIFLLCIVTDCVTRMQNPNCKLKFYFVVHFVII